MTLMDARQPPRFVPTLTDVVSDHSTQAREGFTEQQTHDSAELEVSEEAQATEIIHPASLPILDAEPDRALLAQSIQTSIMDRLDSVLEERLRYALADLVQLHTQAMYQAIRLDVERLVNASVHEAIAQELAHIQKIKNS